MRLTPWTTNQLSIGFVTPNCFVMRAGVHPPNQQIRNMKANSNPVTASKPTPTPTPTHNTTTATTPTATTYTSATATTATEHRLNDFYALPSCTSLPPIVWVFLAFSSWCAVSRVIFGERTLLEIPVHTRVRPRCSFCFCGQVPRLQCCCYGASSWIMNVTYSEGKITNSFSVIIFSSGFFMVGPPGFSVAAKLHILHLDAVYWPGVAAL